MNYFLMRKRAANNPPPLAKARIRVGASGESVQPLMLARCEAALAGSTASAIKKRKPAIRRASMSGSRN